MELMESENLFIAKRRGASPYSAQLLKLLIKSVCLFGLQKATGAVSVFLSFDIMGLMKTG